MKFLFFLLTLFLSFTVQAEILEYQHFNEIISCLKEDDLVLAEVDNILLKPKTELSSTYFFKYLKEEMLKQGFEPEEVLSRLYPLWVKVQSRSQGELSDASLPLFFKELKIKNIDFMVLSHRGPALAFHTYETLNRLGVNFKTANSQLKKLFLKDERASFFDQMLFIHPLCEKKEYLLKLLDGIEPFPKRIVYVDYELVNLINIKQALESKGIPFLGIYYKNCNLNLSDYTIEIGKTQLEYLDKILPDSIANLLVVK